MKNIKIITIVLAIILVTLVAFGGVYLQTQNRMENKVKDYTLGRELAGARVFELKIVDGEGEGETKPNPEDLTLENYETVKKTIEERLDNLGAQDYVISLNKENGTIRVELAEDENTDTYAYFLTASGKVEIKEKDASTVLLSDSMVKDAVYTYTSDAEGMYKVYIELRLTEEGQAKIEEIKNNYAILEEEVSKIEEAEIKKEAEKKDKEEKAEGTTAEEKTETEPTKKIGVLTIGGTELDIERIEKNKVIVKVGGETANTTSINNNIASAAELTLLIRSGKVPVQYEISTNRFIYSDITEQQLLYFAIAVAIILLIVFVIFTISYKVKGLLASVSFIAFVAILSLILRYTNVLISIEGIGAILVVLALNLRFNKIILDKVKTMNVINEAITSTYKEFFLKLIPVIIITLVFCFAGWSNLNSFGMIMFWGLMLIAVYNALVTKTLLKLKEIK